MMKYDATQGYILLDLQEKCFKPAEKKKIKLKELVLHERKQMIDLLPTIAYIAVALSKKLLSLL